MTQARTRFGEPSGAGPWLFGRFCAADAMFAPVAVRFRTFNVELESAAARAWVATVLADADLGAWEKVAMTEEAAGRAIAHYDATCLEKAGPVRE